MAFDWYEIIKPEDSISQGDIINCPVPVLTKTETYPFYTVDGADITGIVMTQACDLENGRPKVNEITICPLKPLSEYIEEKMHEIYRETADFDYSNLKKKQLDRKTSLVEEIKRGDLLDFYLLNKCEIDNRKLLDFNIVLLRYAYRIPVDAINRIIVEKNENRLRLQPPYREHLSFSYAYNFSRIGLPQDIQYNISDI
ncbi:TPA: hypothetical protein VBX77_001766 [Yersinia enterocolitica]|nr:hypothetical protein [Yersinia enterocolitica]